jgi:serine phosphatase RsbU (regulator of sigma subunit)
MRKRILILFFITAIITSFKPVNEEKSPAEQRAEYLLYIVNNITWPNEAEIDFFTIGVLEHQPLISKELYNLAENRKTKSGKPIKIIRFPDIEYIVPTQMLYINRTDGYDIATVLREIAGKKTLLISENYEFQTSMINFIIVDNVLRFEMNIARIENEGLKAAPLFTAKSIKSESDWVNLFHQVETMLFKEKEIVEKQSIQIEEQQEIIIEQIETIEAQNKKIDEQNREILQQTKRLQNLDSVITKREREIQTTMKVLEEKNVQIIESIKKIEIAEEDLAEKTIAIEEKEQVIKEQDNQIFAQLKEIEQQKLIIAMAITLSIFLVGLGYFIYRSYLIKKQANIALQQKNDQIKKQRDEIEIQRNLAIEQRDVIAKQNKNIQDSINYARRIQEAVLPPKELLVNKLRSFFILNKPKEIVSGDYYWMAAKNENLIIAAADCTGHGVPGAFMSMLGVAFLNEIVNKMDELQSDKILNMLREYVINSLRQTGRSGEANDGMDIALCIINTETLQIQYSGANNPLYLVRPNVNNTDELEFHEKCQLLKQSDTHYLYRIKADVMPVAIHVRADIPFSKHHFNLKQGDALYLFSDGYIDQFGGPNGRKYGTSGFSQKIIDIQHISMEEQFTELDVEIETWRNYPNEKRKNNPQIDDILVIGVRF